MKCAAELADDDPAAPWMSQIYGGMLPSSARRSWEAAQRQSSGGVPAALVSRCAAEIVPDHKPVSAEPSLVEPIDRAGSPPWMTGAITASELQTENYPPVRYLLPGYIPEGVNLLVGKPKIGKGWMALDLCIASAADRYTLGTIKPTCGDVLYLALEDSNRRLQRRLRKLLPDVGTWPPRLTFQTNWRRANEGGLDDIQAWCKSVREPTLIVIDTLERFRAAPKAGAHTYSTDYETLAGLQAITKDIPGLTILVVHHDRKMGADDPFDTVSGTLGLNGAADTILIMRRHAGGVVLNVRGRDVEESETPLQFNKNSCKWTMLGAEAAAAHISTERQQIINALGAFRPSHDKDGMAVAEIMAATERSDRNSVDQLRFKMSRDGEIARVKRGVYRLPEGAGKIDKKERNSTEDFENTRESSDLANLTDLTGHADDDAD
jgi:hypothetical protein